MKKKILSLLLCVPMLASLFAGLGVTAYAAETPAAVHTEAEGCTHPGVEHFYLTGTFTDDFDDTYAAGTLFDENGTGTEYNSDQSVFIRLDKFPANAATEKWYYWDSDSSKYALCSAKEPEWQTFGGCQWSIDSAGMLAIKPADSPAEGYTAGQLPDGYTRANNWPWYNYKSTIKSVIVEEGVTAGDSLAYMFDQCKNLTSIDLSGLNTSGTKSMKRMVDICSSLVEVKGLVGLDTSKVTDISYMFCGCTSLSKIDDLDKFDTSAVESMQGVFTTSGLSAEKRVEYINAFLARNGGKCTDWTNRLFCGCTDDVIDLSGLDTSNATDMESMFASCISIESLDLSALDTSKVTTMNYMFRGCSALKTIYVGKGWSTAALLTPSQSIFESCSSLIGGAGTSFDANHTDATYAHIDGGENNPGYLTEVLDLTEALNIGVKLDNTTIKADGTQKTVIVTVTWDGKTLTEGTDYTVTGNTATEPGNYILTVTGKGRFTGSVTRVYNLYAEETQKETVKVDEKDFTVSCEQETKDAPGVTIDTATMVNILNNDDKTALNGGASMTAIVVVSPATADQLDPASKAALEQVVGSLTNAKFVDLSVYVTTTTDTDTTTVQKTMFSDAISVTMDIPTDIANAPSGYTRSFAIVRSHKENGVYTAEKLNSTVANGKITFATDKCSDYAIVYTDTIIPTSSDDGTSASTKAGDSSNLTLYICLLIGMSLLTLCGMTVYTKKR